MSQPCNPRFLHACASLYRPPTLAGAFRTLTLRWGSKERSLWPSYCASSRWGSTAAAGVRLAEPTHAAGRGNLLLDGIACAAARQAPKGAAGLSIELCECARPSVYEQCPPPWKIAAPPRCRSAARPAVHSLQRKACPSAHGMRPWGAQSTSPAHRLCAAPNQLPVQMIFAIVAFATIVEYDSFSSKIRFTVSTENPGIHQPQPVHHRGAGCHPDTSPRNVASSPWPLPCPRPQMFTGITAFILAFFFMVLYVVGVGIVSRSARCRPSGPCPAGSPKRNKSLLAVAGLVILHPSVLARPLQARGIVSLVIDSLWVIFWLVRAARRPARATAFPNSPPAPRTRTSRPACHPASDPPTCLHLVPPHLLQAAAACMSDLVAGGGTNSDIKASCAFSWLSWFLWIASAVISFMDWRRGSPGPSPTGPPPAIPNSSVSMV